MYYSGEYPSPLGPIRLVCDDEALLRLSLPGQADFDREALEADHPILDRTKDWLDRYFAGRAPSPAQLPLGPEGTPFRQLIWRLLLDIPYGKTASYGDLAREAARILGKKRMSAQAVGSAVGANPIPVIIPCHRVLGADGSLTGYAGGLHHKIALLQLEAPELRLVGLAGVADAHTLVRFDCAAEAVVLDP